MVTCMTYWMSVAVAGFLVFLGKGHFSLAQLNRQIPCPTGPCVGEHVVCVKPPLVDSINESYCMDCWRRRKTCGTLKQLAGCNGYCLENARLTEERKWQTQIEVQNRTCQDALAEKEDDAELHKQRLHVIVWVLGSVVTCLLIVMGIYYKHMCKHASSKACNDEDLPLTEPQGKTQTNETQPATRQESTTVKGTQCCYGKQKLQNVPPAQDDQSKNMAIS